MSSSIPDLPVQLTVDPLQLAIAGRPVTESATALRQSLPSLDVAWLAAAHVLARQATGDALQVGRPALQKTFDACTAELAGVGEALHKAATIYDQADGSASPVPR